jgi:hypothetical protein
VLRLTLDGSARLFSASRARVAALDTALVLLASLVIALVAQTSIWQVAGVVGLCYYAVATTCFGRSPVAWWLLRPPVRAVVPDTNAARERDDAAELRLAPGQTESSPVAPSAPQAPGIH